ncbi:hypothetical protein JL721_11018 [Aureococcus anophagefferens]|nr:hypothetical protein JL721_11018 [Aureococcus anophagefferens]
MMADRIAAHVRALREGDDASKTAAARELGSLAFSSSNPENKVLIAQAGGIEPLVQLLHDGSAVAKVRAVRALGSLAWNDANKVLIAGAGGRPAARRAPARRGRAWQAGGRGSSAHPLSRNNNANKALITEAGGIPLLVQFLRGAGAGAKSEAVWALQNLAEHNGANKLAIAEAGGIPLLVELAREGGRRLTLTSRGAIVALGILAWNNDANAVAIAAALGFDALVQLARRGRVNFKGYTLVRNAGLPAKRKAALVVAQLIEATAPRTRVPAVLKAAIGSYL